MVANRSEKRSENWPFRAFRGSRNLYSMRVLEHMGLPARTRTWNHRLGGGSYILFNYREQRDEFTLNGTRVYFMA
jgi:hypothetical protein